MFLNNSTLTHMQVVIVYFSVSVSPKVLTVWLGPKNKLCKCLIVAAVQLQARRHLYHPAKLSQSTEEG